MSGGVDSSVAARLLVDQVWKDDFLRFNALTKLDRITIFQPYICAIGTPETNPEQTMVVNGKKTGKTCNVSVACLTYHIA